MCGICGYLGFDDPGLLQKMTEALAHRGPDDAGTHTAPGVGLGHRRLSIIDLSAAGRQPMANEDGTVWVAFNGEIYNFGNLRPDLEAAGHRFRSRTDTEVLVHGYEAWGAEGLLNRLRGMFALALWDARTRALLLARDPLGKKPLFYARTPRGLVFASEPKALYLDPALDRTIDRGALRKYLFYGYVPAPASLHPGLHKVRPGHYLLVRDGTSAERPYWQPPTPGSAIRPPALPEAVDRLETLLGQAVERRLISDVPLGIFLSGGLDSGTIAALAARRAGGRVRTFAIGFTETSYDESGHARRVARHIGAEHTEETLTPARLLDVIPTLAQMVDEPMADASIIPTLLLSQMARRHVTVALGGDGGDELFAGYPTYLGHQVADVYDRLPASLRHLVIRPLSELLPARFGNYTLDYMARKFVEASGEPPGVRHHLWMRYFSPAEVGRVLSEPLPAEDDLYTDIAGHLAGQPPMDSVATALHLNLGLYMQDCILVKVDRASMATSLEVRSPFLDRDVVDFVIPLPLHLKLRRGGGKVLLKALAQRYLPPSIVQRRKQGFTVPVGEWVRGPLRPLLRDALAPARLARQGLFDGTAVAALLTEHEAGRRNRWKELWALLVFQLWWERYGT
ncbi:MAG TPA: asparagine synthase (glutamine-hydrolyzing) [Candidatus Sulfotelmatobacter sp.]|nr:asparagine synthase (glutamine-hydrolyzing) [Candidatus Sulfotelmatobacter sp.]